MHHLKIFQKLRQDIPDRLIDRRRAETSAHYHNDRLRVVKAAQPVRCLLVSHGKFLADRRTRQHRFRRR